MNRPYPLITVAVAGWNLASLALLLAGALVPRVRLSGRGPAAVIRTYIYENRRRFGSMVAHFGIIVVAVGVMAASAYRVDEQARLNLNEPYAFQGYELTAVSLFQESAPGEASSGAVVEISRDGRLITTLRPHMKQYAGQEMIVPTPASFL